MDVTSGAISTDAGTEWLHVADEDLRGAARARRPLRFAHSAGLHRDFEPSALQVIGARLPTAWVVVNDGRLPQLCPPRPNLRFEDGGAALRALYEQCFSVRLYHVNHVPEVGGLVRDVLDQAERILGSYGGGPVRRDASLFCGSPGSTVPIHGDRHDNLLLQLVGTKTVKVWSFLDPARELAEIERNVGRHLNLEVVPDAFQVFELGPGDGVYLPPYTIHSVECGPEASTALSASFSTVASERAELVHLANRQLRRLHVRPRGPGASRVADRTKAAVVTTLRRAKRWRGRDRDR